MPVANLVFRHHCRHLQIASTREGVVFRFKELYLLTYVLKCYTNVCEQWTKGFKFNITFKIQFFRDI